MATKNNNGGQAQLQQPAMTPMQRFNSQIRGINAQSYLTSVLGKRKDPFVTSLISVVAANEALQQCDPMSVVYTALKAAALNLPIDPSLGYAAIIPYNDTKRGVCNAQFQVQRNGWMELLQRTGQVRRIVNEVVYEGQLVKRNKFTGEYVFDEDAKTSDKVAGYMAYVKLTNGFEHTVYWTADECTAHGKRYSQSFRKGYGLWVDQFDAMCLKTVLKNLIVKYCPKSQEILAAIGSDQAVYNGENEAEWQDNPNDTPENIDEAVSQRREEMRGVTPETADMP